MAGVNLSFYGSIASLAIVEFRPPAGEKYVFNGWNTDGSPDNSGVQLQLKDTAGYKVTVYDTADLKGEMNGLPYAHPDVTHGNLVGENGTFWVCIYNAAGIGYNYAAWFLRYATGTEHPLKTMRITAVGDITPPAGYLWIVKGLFGTLGNQPNLQYKTVSLTSVSYAIAASMNQGYTGIVGRPNLVLSTSLWMYVASVTGSSTLMMYAEIPDTALAAVGTVAAVAASAYMDIRSPAGETWILQTISPSFSYLYNGTTRSVVTAAVSTSWAWKSGHMQIPIGNDLWVQLQNTGGSTANMGYSGWKNPL